jgi:hypothetical protein
VENQVENISLLQIDEVMYPTLEVRSNAGHSQQGDHAGTMLKFGQQVQKLDNRPGKYALVVSVSSDEETSRNAPYRFVVEAYAVVGISGAALEGDAAVAFILTNGLPVVMGAIRERLADATARAPWGRFMINAVPLPQPAQINSI